MTTQQLASQQSDPQQSKSVQFSPERLMQVLRAPQISEKATYVGDKHKQMVFRVAVDATKPEIKAAVEMMFKVSVDSVNVANVMGKTKRSGRVIGRRNDWKKAYVCLAAGQEINFAASEQG